MDKIAFTPIEELGEFGLIDFLTKDLKNFSGKTIKSVGDDCAVIDLQGKKLLISTDMMVHGVHFDLDYFPLQHLGYKAITSSISDIYAMNAMASQLTVSIAVSNHFSVEMLELLYSGMKTACENYQVDFVGGDTTTLGKGLIICVTALGYANQEDIVYRKGSAKNEILCVSGDLGAAYTGLLILEREKQVYLVDKEMQPQLDDYEYILKRILRPEARKDIIDFFAKMKIKPTSMIDISDGLSSEIFHLCKQSGVGVKLFEDKIPLDPMTYNTARELNLDPTLCALNGGEDYELLFTLEADDFEKVKNSPDITPIGHITDEDYGIKMISKSGNEHPIKAQGWKVFNKSE